VKKLCVQRYAVSQEELRPYFSEDHVLSGMFTVVEAFIWYASERNKSVDVGIKTVRFFFHIDGC